MFFQNLYIKFYEFVYYLFGRLLAIFIPLFTKKLTFLIIAIIIIYIYTSLAYFTIAKKLNYKKAWLA
jgi:hypothetical protein